MSIFLLAQTNLSDTAKIVAKLSSLFPDDHYAAGGGSWLISADETAKGLSEKLGIVDGEISSVIIAEIASYHGRADPDIWSWIKDKWEG